MPIHSIESSFGEGDMDTSFLYRLVQIIFICLVMLEISSCKTTSTDQGSQFTSDQWISYLKDSGITISMDGKGRWLDNVAIERFWRSIKYEDIYLKSYETVNELAKGVKTYITRYNQYRPHQSLNEATPEEIYSGKMKIAV